MSGGHFEAGFDGCIAVVTGAGTGMGRELVRQLAADGCDVAMCDVIEANMRETAVLVAADGSRSAVLSVVADFHLDSKAAWDDVSPPGHAFATFPEVDEFFALMHHGAAPR